MQVNSFARSLKKGSFQLVGLNQETVTESENPGPGRPRGKWHFPCLKPEPTSGDPLGKPSFSSVSLSHLHFSESLVHVPGLALPISSQSKGNWTCSQRHLVVLWQISKVTLRLT